MSFCQPENAKFSCGACCGYLNLKIQYEEIKILLKERTNLFKSEVNLNKNHSIASFRQISEKKEEFFEKNDTTTYNCPFLGYLDPNYEKIGCMIHPSNTNNPKSQNFSFYGESICQGYDCKNKESNESAKWERILSKMKLDSIEYSKIASDHITLSLIEKIFSSPDFKKNGFFYHSKLLEEIFQHKLDPKKNPDLQNPTSFEINYISQDNDPFNTLCARLNILHSSQLYMKIQNAMGTV